MTLCRSLASLKYLASLLRSPSSLFCWSNNGRLRPAHPARPTSIASTLLGPGLGLGLVAVAAKSARHDKRQDAVRSLQVAESSFPCYPFHFHAAARLQIRCLPHAGVARDHHEVRRRWERQLVQSRGYGNGQRAGVRPPSFTRFSRGESRPKRWVLWGTTPQ